MENTVARICKHKKIWYNDIKPDNIAVVDNTLKLIDLDAFIPADMAGDLFMAEEFDRQKEKHREEIQERLTGTHSIPTNEDFNLEQVTCARQ